MSCREVGALCEIVPSCWNALRMNDPTGSFMFKRICQTCLEAEASAGNVHIIQMLVRVCVDICPEYHAVEALTEAIRAGRGSARYEN